MSLLQFELPVTELMSDEIYNFPKTERNWDFYDYPEDIYLIMKSELNCYCIFRGDWRTNEDHYRMNVQEIKAISDFKAFSTINYNLPLYFQGNRTIKTYQTTTVREKTYFAKPAFYNV